MILRRTLCGVHDLSEVTKPIYPSVKLRICVSLSQKAASAPLKVQRSDFTEEQEEARSTHQLAVAVMVKAILYII